MSSKKHKTDSKPRPSIGLLLQDLQFPLHFGAVEGAREHDANLFCFLGDMAKSADPALKQNNIAFSLANPKRLDALALWGASGAGVGINLDQAEMNDFIQQYTPRPVVNYERKIDGVPVILTDVYQGVREAIRHLIEIHHCQRIALIWGPAGHFETEERVRAYRDTLIEYNLPVDPKLISEPVQWGVEGGVLAINSLLHGETANLERGLIPGVDFDAIFTTDGRQAVAVVNELHRQGIQVPDDVAIIGFDERDESRLTSPPLTTVNKPFAEIGKQLIELAIDAANGKTIPEETHNLTQIIIRQSCGCVDPAILQASLDKTQASQEKFDIIINTRRGNFIDEIINGMQAAVLTSDASRIRTMVESFVKELEGESTGGFTRALNDFLYHEMSDITDHVQHSEQFAEGEDKYQRPLYDNGTFDGSTWQNMVSAMQWRMLPYLDGKKRVQADALWNQARIAIGASAQRLQAYQAFLADQKAQILREIEANLSIAFNQEALSNVLATGLPRLGIPSCYLSLYENPSPYEYPQPAPEWSRLVLAYTEKGRISLPEDGVRFHTHLLVPDGMLPQDRQASYFIFPLYFGEEQQGFILLEIGPQESAIYNVLKSQIASALHGASLVKRIEERAIRLQAAAEVSRASSSILNPDELIHQVVELIRERFNLYYVGLFLLDEDERYALLRAGTGDPGKQMVSQGHRLEVGSNSMIGWCIANQKARIALDVGNEPVRFENPLLPATRSELALPLLARGVAIGAVTVQSEQEAAFSESDVAILQSMADQLANAIENTRLLMARQQAEDALRESELLYTSLVENMNFNVFRKDLEGRYTYANDAFCNVMNTSLVKLLGKTDYDFSPKEIADKYRSDDMKVKETGKPLEIIEEHVLTENIETTSSETEATDTSEVRSGVRYIQTLKAPVRNTRGDIIGIQGAFWDVSDQRKTEKEMERRAVQLQTTSEISKAASSLLDVNELTQQAVDLIHDRFGLYYVGLFLIDQSGEWTTEAGRWVVLRAGTGEAGQKMISQGHKLEIGGTSMIGWCTANNSPRITLDTRKETDENIRRFKNPLLPETQSEMALPLSSRGQVLGALSIQSTQRNAFTNEDITILQSMADQLANAIANASLYEQTQTALREMESIYRRYLVRGWSEYSQTRSASGYRRSEKGVTPLGADLLPEVEQAMLESRPATLKTTGEAEPTLVVPIKLRDFPIGAIGLKANEEQRQWSEDDISLIEILSEQFALAAENIRLLEETQRRAEREHLVSEITTRLRTSNDPQTILQTAASELRRALNAKSARVLIESIEQLAARREMDKQVADERGEK
jgi:GAF domain-containing protein/DNA-binding LacI/PurR family transcriptional regulator